MNKSLSIVILAAGKGTRMKSSLPKVLHKICGRPMLYYGLKESLLVSDDVCVVLGFESEKIQQEICHFFGTKVRFIHQDLTNFPGTGGALKNYVPKHQNVLILNGDMPLIQAQDLENLCLKSAESHSAILMSTFQTPSHWPIKNGYGRVIAKNGEVQEIIEEKDASKEILENPNNHLNGGIYTIRKDILESYIPKLTNNNAQKEYYLTDIIALAKQDNLKIQEAYFTESQFANFQGVNDKLDLARAEAIISTRIKESLMRQGVTMRLPETIYIEEGVEFVGECIIENGVSIQGDSKIISSHIKAHSVIESSLVESSDIGPFAHLRPQSILKNTHIGNFVEIKKSQLNGVKAGHLSYIGDSEIGDGTNVGAGFITCNYDGKTKHKTKIGKNVFIGSDSQAVAPLYIEDDCIIGAGSTIRRNLKKGELFLTHGKEIIKEGFFYHFFSKKT